MLIIPSTSLLQLQNANDRLNRDHRDLQVDYKSLKSEMNQLRMRLSEVEKSLSKQRELASALEVSLNKEANRGEVSSGFSFLLNTLC